MGQGALSKPAVQWWLSLIPSITPLVRGDIYVATTSSSNPSARSEWEC